jgi:hypothetical protein
MDVVILQPFYLPYAGVFELVRMADVFVFYDDVQLTRRSWMCRNQIKTAQGTQWLTVPVLGPRDSTIHEAPLNESENWRRKHRTAIEHAYAGAPHRSLILDALGPIWDQEFPDLAALNIASFAVLCELMDVKSTFVRSSEMNVPGASSERILAVCEALDADRYISGPSARDYLDEESFVTAGIELCYHRFDAPTYRQLHGDFVPNLSVVDLIANEGPDAPAIVRNHGVAVPAAEFGAELG